MTHYVILFADGKAREEVPINAFPTDTRFVELQTFAALAKKSADLLAALEAAADLMEQEDFATLNLVPKLRAAIAKARQS